MARPNPGKPPSPRGRRSTKTRLGVELVECPHANEPTPPKPPVYIPDSAPKPEGVIRGEGEPALIRRLAALDAARSKGPRINARLASYGLEPLPTPTAGAAGPVIPNLVQIANTSILPYRQICMLEIAAAAGPTLQGSGWLAAPNLVITAGHCVFQRNYNRWADFVRVHLAVAGSVEPYETQDSHKLKSLAEWTNDGETAYDVGAIILPNDFEGPPGNFGYDRVPSDAELDALLVALVGYPLDVPTRTMWGDQGYLTGISPIQIFYGIESRAAMSGAPVFYTEGEERHIVGIHNYGGGPHGNYATRLTQPIKGAIMAWAQEAQNR